MRPCWCVLPLLACAAAGQVQLPAPGTDPRPPVVGKGAIEGTVLNQLTREPLPKVHVTLGGPGRMMNAVTGADGRFAFRGLAPATYYFNANRPGYLPPEDPFPPVGLGPDEQKRGIELALAPGASISGVVLNERGKPVPGCSVSAGQMDTLQGITRFNARGVDTTNDRGEYRVDRLPAGRYYLTLQCGIQLPLPHPLMDRDDPRVPYAVYAPQVYPGSPGFTGATRITVAPGADLRGMDFNVRRTPAATVYGRVAGDPAAASRDIQVAAVPADASLSGWTHFSAGVNRETGEFRIPSLLPGSYLLIAMAAGEGPPYQARVPVEIGSTPPAPVDIRLAAGPELKGTVEIQGDNPPSPESVRVVLIPMDMQMSWWSQPRTAQVEKDGAFTVAGVWPGRWRLDASGPWYAKSLRLGAEDVSPFGFTVKAGMAGDARLVLSTKHGRVAGTLPGGAREMFVIAVPEDPALVGIGLERIHGPFLNGAFDLQLVPGRYRVFVVETPRGWDLANRPSVLKVMAERRGQSVEVAEGGRATVAPDVVSAAELRRVIEEAP